MKIRMGFVSNSSSSSFVIRGIKMNTVEFAKKIGIKEENCDFTDYFELYEKIYSKIYKKTGYKLNALTIEMDKYFYSDDAPENIIIGTNLCNLENGQVSTIPEPNDEKTREKIEEIIGEEVFELKTYIQYVSNDNY